MPTEKSQDESVVNALRDMAEEWTARKILHRVLMPYAEHKISPSNDTFKVAVDIEAQLRAEMAEASSRIAGHINRLVLALGDMQQPTPKQIAETEAARQRVLAELEQCK